MKTVPLSPGESYKLLLILTFEGLRGCLLTVKKKGNGLADEPSSFWITHIVGNPEGKQV